MSLTVKHHKVSAIADDPAAVAAGQVVPSDWNADHQITGTLPASDVTGLAAVATSGAYGDLSGTPSLAAVATTGAYADLTGKPSLATVATTGAYADLSGKPTLGTLASQDANNVAITGGSVAGSTVSGNISGNAANVTGTVAIGNGGTGQTTANAALNALLPSQTSQSGKYLTTDGTNTSWAAAGGGSATLTIDNKTGAYTVVAGDLGKIINCTSGTFTVSLTAAATLGAGFNCWVWNTGTGAITIDPASTETIDGVSTLILRQGEGTQIVCDGTNWATGDGKRARGYAENYGAAEARPVATTGTNAIAIGKAYASGTDSFAAALASNSSSYGATGANSVAIGREAKAQAQFSVAVGYQPDAQATGSVAIGRQTVASGTYSVCIGYGARTSLSNGFAFGRNSNSAQVGKYAYASDFFAGVGDAQTGLFVLRRATTNATAVVLTTDNAAPTADNQVVLPNNSAYAFTGTVIARQKAGDGTASAAWKIEGLIRREANAASTTLVASTVTAIDNTPGWTLALSADTTNGGLKIEATGAAATNIRWVATVQTSEVTYA